MTHFEWFSLLADITTVSLLLLVTADIRSLMIMRRGRR